MKVAIIGRNQLLYSTALAIKEAGHEIACIITAKASPEYEKKEDDFKKLAEKMGVPFFLTNTLDMPEIEKICKGLDIGISVNWVSVIKQKHIDLFKYGILNSHHGDLPKYRGNACSNWAIINNEKYIVNTIHFMEGEKLDCGRVILQEKFELNEDKTITDVYKWSEKIVPLSYVKALKILQEKPDFTLKYADVNSPESFRCYPRLPEDSFIDWKKPATEIHNLIRAVSYPYSGAYTYHWHKGEVKKLIILKSKIVSLETKDIAVPGHVLKNDKESGESYVKCGDGILALLKCKYEGEEEFMPGKKWKSIRMRLGIRPEDWLWRITNILKANKQINMQ